MDGKNITRLLKLYKQHYLKSYEKMAEMEYSCWGYFDCMEVDLVENRKERGLLMSDKNGDMADLWYASANTTEELSGHYGQQNIGLFRYEAKGQTLANDQEFWKKENKGIILIACMIQLEEDSDIDHIMAEMEQTISKEMGIYGITYRTFDNFDLILFLKGNSYVAMADVIEKLGKRKNIRYKYSICGIAQEYLDQVDEDSEIDDIEYNGRSLVNNEIAEVWLEIVSDGKADLNNLSADFEDGTEYARVLGYMDNTICIRNTNMWKVVRLFRGGTEGLTHKNKEFGKGIYNISTVILPKWETIKHDQSPILVAESEKINGWCMKKIEVLSQYWEGYGDTKNEVLYSNWLALIRVLNVLSQYENSLFSKDIFRIIFPSMKQICSKFEDILKNYKARNFMKQGYDNVLIIESYINEVDGMIQHLIHTSQTFLMVPGYSGSLYDIPTKMLLFYMAYAYKVIVNFDDSDQKFGCFICPRLNSKPEVREIEIKTKDEFLLDIRLAQRHLYMPRAFVIILTHELYHYIGNESRSRQERANHLLKMCVYALTYRLLDVKKDSGLMKQFEKPKKNLEKNIQVFLINTIPEVFNEKNKSADETPYMSATLLRLMTDCCYAVLNDGNHRLNETLRELDQINWKDVVDLKKDLSQWNNYLQEVEKKRKETATKEIIEEIVGQFIYSFQEIYADLSSIICLDFELKYYFEAILVSEGMMLDEGFDSILVINRLAVVVYTLSRASCKWGFQWYKLKKDKSASFKNLITKIQEYIAQMTSKNDQRPQPAKEKTTVEQNQEEETTADQNQKEIHEWPYFYLDGVWDEQVKYAESCIDKLRKAFSDDEKKKRCAEEIRETFGWFKMHGLGGDRPYSDLFGNYDKLIKEYNDAIDCMVTDEIGKNAENVC